MRLDPMMPAGHHRRQTSRSSRGQPQARPQAHSSALMHPFQSFFEQNSLFGNHCFGNTRPFGNIGNMDNLFDSAGFGAFNNPGASGNSVVYSSSTFAQQGPDGVQYQKSHSSSYGPEGVRQCADLVWSAVTISAGTFVAACTSFCIWHLRS